MVSDSFVLSGDIERVCQRLRARFGPSVSDHAIDTATAAAFARYRSARVKSFVALLAERDARRRLTGFKSAPAAREIADTPCRMNANHALGRQTAA
jgi:hypothetical protein